MAVVGNCPPAARVGREPEMKRILGTGYKDGIYKGVYRANTSQCNKGESLERGKRKRTFSNDVSSSSFYPRCVYTEYLQNYMGGYTALHELFLTHDWKVHTHRESRSTLTALLKRTQDLKPTADKDS